MKKIILILALIFCVVSCNTIKEVPVQTVEKIVYHDSLIYIVDSVEVAVPYEVIKTISLQTDTSYLKTSLAESIAYIDTTNNKLFHTLTQNGKLKAKVDTVFRVEYVDKIIEREIVVEVDKIEYKYDWFFWLLFTCGTLWFLYLIYRIYRIFKK